MKKKYNSFSEIDDELKILRLRKEIAKESLTYNLKSTRKNLNLKQIMETTRFNTKQFVIDFALNKGLNWLHKLRRKP
ncbi:DUF6327 family protein [Cellulophaga sp. L1A9]|uniref:DUF6327 family protein n=1 Tax=Cellulophaga sp. L1A9 TaxID=2686362 RepID=UPI00131E4664|nr:DUF6327 family protein [Cellulophaga sp. L1A9]